MKTIFLFLCLLLLPLLGQNQTSKYLIFFKDKQSAFLKSKAEQEKWVLSHLSQKAIHRRELRGQGVLWDESDLPIPEQYIQKVIQSGAKIIHRLRWFNAVSVKVNSEKMLQQLKSLPFVKEVRPVKTFKFKKDFKGQPAGFSKPAAETGNLLGPVIRFVDADSLKNAGFDGTGVIVGVFDTGFELSHPVLSNIKNHLIAQYDFVENDSLVEGAEEGHGTITSSVIGGVYSDSVQSYEGLAPGANFILCRTEYVATETHVEEDNWAAAAQFAESLGVDIISTSLGYSTFDPGEGDYTYQDMDGKTTIITQAANMMTQKGVVVVVSAGNEGTSSWHYITAPADGFDVISVGAIGLDSVIASFSSYGPTADGRVKPEIVAPGVRVPGAYANYISSPLTTASGTSLACPVVAGGLALILQAYPDVSIQDLRTAIIETANAGMIKNATQVPGDQYGYGVIQVSKIYNTLSMVDSIGDITDNYGDIVLGPNPVSFSTGYMLYSIKQGFKQPVVLSIYNILGQKLLEYKFSLSSGIIPLQPLRRSGAGIYIFKLDVNGKQFVRKIVMMK